MAKAPAPARHRAWETPLFTEGEIAAIKGMASTNKLAFDTIIVKVCRYYDMSFAPGGEDGRRESDFAEGRRSCAAILLDIRARELKPRTRGPEPGHTEPAPATPTKE